MAFISFSISSFVIFRPAKAPTCNTAATSSVGLGGSVGAQRNGGHDDERHVENDARP